MCQLLSQLGLGVETWLKIRENTAGPGKDELHVLLLGFKTFATRNINDLARRNPGKKLTLCQGEGSHVFEHSTQRLRTYAISRRSQSPYCYGRRHISTTVFLARGCHSAWRENLFNVFGGVQRFRALNFFGRQDHRVGQVPARPPDPCERHNCFVVGHPS